MKQWEHYAYLDGGKLDIEIMAKWERFAQTGNCGEIACVQCPFRTMRCMEAYKDKDEDYRLKVIMEKLNEEV